MSRRKHILADQNLQSGQASKRFKSSTDPFNVSTFRNVFEQFDDILPATVMAKPCTPSANKTKVSKTFSQHSPSAARSIMSQMKVSDNQQLWSTVFQPKTPRELLVHSKKVKELGDILTRACGINKDSQQVPKLILITGPSGSGKSTCLRVLASSLNIRVIEWETRTTSSLTSTMTDERSDNYHQWTESQKRSFRTFVFQSARYLSSTNGHENETLIFDNDESETKSFFTNKQLVLIEDIPNGFYSDVGSFHSTLRELKRIAHHPIFFILTENSSLSSAYNPHLLFSLPLLDELKIEQINFNSIAPTFMKKALESISPHLKFQEPTFEQLTEIIEIANGDLRLAINTLQFSNYGQRKTKSKTVTPTSKDTCLSLFQGLGRLLYKKNFEDDVKNLGKKNDEHLIEQCHISAPTFIGFLFENYLDFYSSIDDAANLCENFSYTDYLINEWESRLQLTSICSAIVCRAIRLCNSEPTGRAFRPLRKPMDTDIHSRAQKHRSLLNTNKLHYGCSEQEYYTNVLPYQAHLLKMTRSTANATNDAISQMGFIHRYSRIRSDPNSMVTLKNSSIALLTDQHQSNENQFNFSLFQSTKIQSNQYEYDDQVDIETIED